MSNKTSSKSAGKRRAKITCTICNTTKGKMGLIHCKEKDKKLIKKIFKCTGVQVTPIDGAISPVCGTCNELIECFDEGFSVCRDFVVESEISASNVNYDPLCEVAPTEPLVEIVVDPEVKIKPLPPRRSSDELDRPSKPTKNEIPSALELQIPLTEVIKSEIKIEESNNEENIEDSDWEWPLDDDNASPAGKDDEEEELEKDEIEKRPRKSKRGRKKKSESKVGKILEKCEICEKEVINMNKHMKYHDKTNLLQCEHCERTFTQRSGLNYHIRKHTGERPFECLICGNAYLSASHLKDHLVSHTLEKKFQCHVCSKRFNLAYKLTLHLKTHSGLKPFDCNVCGKTFNKKHNRDVHVQRHMGIKNAICEICSKGFINVHALKRHMRSHEDIPEGDDKKPRRPRKTVTSNRFGPAPDGLVCDICQKQFEKKNLMKRHRQLHFDEDGNPRIMKQKARLVIDERTPRCDICNRPFATIKSMKEHRVKHFMGGEEHPRAFRAIEKIPLKKLEESGPSNMIKLEF